MFVMFGSGELQSWAVSDTDVITKQNGCQRVDMDKKIISRS